MFFEPRQKWCSTCTMYKTVCTARLNCSTYLTWKIVNVLEFRFQLIGKVSRAVYCLDRNRSHSGHSYIHRSHTRTIYIYGCMAAVTMLHHCNFGYPFIIIRKCGAAHIVLNNLSTLRTPQGIGTNCPRNYALKTPNIWTSKLGGSEFQTICSLYSKASCCGLLFDLIGIFFVLNKLTQLL